MLLSQEIHAWRRSKRFVRYHEAPTVAADLDRLRAQIVDLSRTDPQSATAIFAQFVHLSNMLGRADDSAGDMADVFEKAVNDWGATWARIEERPPDAIAEIVFDEFTENDQGIKDGIIRAFADALGETGLSCLDVLFRKALAVLPPTKRNANVWDPERAMLSRALGEIADVRSDVDGYVKAAAVAGDPLRDAVSIAERMLAANRPAEALDWIDRDPGPYREPERAADARISALTALGREAEAQAARWKRFESTLDRDAFAAYSERVPAAGRNRARARAIGVAKEYAGLAVALDFLTSFGELAEAENVVLTRRDELDGGDYETLRPVASRLRDAHPLGALVIHRALALDILTAKRGSAYVYAARDIKATNQLAARIAQWHGIPDQTTFMAQLRADHRLKSSFWRLLGAD
jgi:hypothetical protein